MEIVNFFEKLAGRWFSQRTTHALSTQQSKAGKSDLEVEFLAPDHEAVQTLYQQQAATSPICAPICGLRIQQSSTIEGDSTPKVATTLLVPLSPQTEKTTASEIYTGILLRSGTTDTSTYALEQEVLTIVSDGAEAYSEERLWFVNDNLRMRTGNTELKGGTHSGLRIASFCTEIRLGAKPPKAD